jgi:MoxR-like ATPase
MRMVPVEVSREPHHPECIETAATMKMIPIPEIDCDTPICLSADGSIAEQYHLFDPDSAGAVRAALAARRPLLVRGEPGVGKTQLAWAASKALGRPLVSRVVDSRTESRDLMYEFDAVLRLADAQIAGALLAASGGTTPRDEGVPSGPLTTKRVHARLAIRNYVRPGPLWWAFDWEGALRQAKRSRSPIPTYETDAVPGRGCVVLIDEIDKAESDVPNGLLEALGSGHFTPLGQIDPVKIHAHPPLVVITTNEERVLPNAFVRRCLVLHLKLPETDEALIAHLVKIAAVHFSERADKAQDVFEQAARLVARDRKQAGEQGFAPLPGQAEYLDTLRAVFELEPRSKKRQAEILEFVAGFAVRKHDKASS